MPRFLTLVLAGAASLSLVACNQAQKAEIQRDSERVDAMTEDLRSDAERTAKDLGSQASGKSSGTGKQGQTRSGATKPKAEVTRDSM